MTPSFDPREVAECPDDLFVRSRGNINEGVAIQSTSLYSDNAPRQQVYSSPSSYGFSQNGPNRGGRNMPTASRQSNQTPLVRNYNTIYEVSEEEPVYTNHGRDDVGLATQVSNLNQTRPERDDTWVSCEYTVHISDMRHIRDESDEEIPIMYQSRDRYRPRGAGSNSQTFPRRKPTTSTSRPLMAYPGPDPAALKHEELVAKAVNAHPGVAVPMSVGGSVLYELAMLKQFAEIVSDKSRAFAEPKPFFQEPKAAWMAIKTVFKSEPDFSKPIQNLKNHIDLVTCHVIEGKIFIGIETARIITCCEKIMPSFEAMVSRLTIVGKILIHRRRGERRDKAIRNLLKNIGDLHNTLGRLFKYLEDRFNFELALWPLIQEECRNSRQDLKKALGMPTPGEVMQDERTKIIAEELAKIGGVTLPVNGIYDPTSSPNAEKYVDMDRVFQVKTGENGAVYTLIPISPTAKNLEAGYFPERLKYENLPTPPQSLEKVMSPSPLRQQFDVDEVDAQILLPNVYQVETPVKTTGRKIVETEIRGADMDEADIADAGLPSDFDHLDWQKIQYGYAGCMEKPLRI